MEGKLGRHFDFTMTWFRLKLGRINGEMISQKNV